MILLSFILPRGWSSALGLMSLGFGIIIAICSLLKMPDQKTYMYHIMMQVLTGQRFPY